MSIQLFFWGKAVQKCFLGHNNGIFKFFWLFLEVFFLTFVLFRPPNLPHVNWGPNEISPLVAYLSKFPAQQPPTLQDVHMAFQSVFFCKKQLCLQASTPNLVFFWTFFYGIFLSRKRCRLLYRSPIKGRFNLSLGRSCTFLVLRNAQLPLQFFVSVLREEVWGICTNGKRFIIAKPTPGVRWSEKEKEKADFPLGWTSHQLFLNDFPS